LHVDPNTQAEITRALNRLADAYARRDGHALRDAFAPDADVVMYGTGADEKRLGRSEILAQAERDWSQTDAVSISWDWTSISGADSVVWVAADATFSLTAGGQQVSFPARVTLVFEQRGGRRLISQAHFSFPAAGQEEGESFPTP
jgi:hypothetical protein